MTAFIMLRFMDSGRADGGFEGGSWLILLPIRFYLSFLEFILSPFGLIGRLSVAIVYIAHLFDFIYDLSDKFYHLFTYSISTAQR